MPTAIHISLEEYLNTAYQPDCDYVDGVVEERNVGMKRHARTQTLLAAWLVARERQYGYQVVVEQRVKVAATRVRVPDVCLLEPTDRDELTQRPPLLCVEVLSPDDRWRRVQIRISDYLAFGIATVWIIDPYTKRAWIATPAGTTQIEDGVLRCANPKLEVALSGILPEE